MASEAHEPTMSTGDRSSCGTVTVKHYAPALAVVGMRGEHDLSTQAALLQALAEAAEHSNVLVDLSECTFFGTSVVALLLRTASAVQARHEQLVLVIPPEQPQLTRVADLMRLADVLPLHSTLPAAILSLAQSTRFAAYAVTT
jgi:anti-anti-sigma factor